jgi:hypothetical protein
MDDINMHSFKARTRESTRHMPHELGHGSSQLGWPQAPLLSSENIIRRKAFTHMLLREQFHHRNNAAEM